MANELETADKLENVKIKFGYQNFSNYRRLSYKWWYAIAEFVDNSTQSYMNHKDEVDEALKNSGESFQVNIVRDEDFIRVSDNAMGMDKRDLATALIVGVPPVDATGRSRYGMGMKTAACWIGNEWTIRTSKLGSTERITVVVDVEKVASGDLIMPILVEEEDADNHYTQIEIRKHNRALAGRTIGKVKQYLSSIYRFDISSEQMQLLYDGETLEWKQFKEEDFLKRKDGTSYMDDYIFEVDTPQGKKIVEGWVGVLKNGSRSKAGFSIFHRRRLIKGWPDSWRPEAIFGAGGRNDLINQRLVGEVNLEDFEVSHTKDEINWHLDEEDAVEQGLKEACVTYIDAARKARRGTMEHGPKQPQIDAAVKALEEELASPEFIEKLSLENVMPPEEVVDQMNENVLSTASTHVPSFFVTIDDIVVKVYLDEYLSINDPYFVNDSKPGDEVLVVINTQHPHWQMLEGENAVTNYLRHCVYDAIAEDRATRKQRLDSDTIKLLKDGYLRVPFEIIQSENEPSTE